jgi:hypothetical protein
MGLSLDGKPQLAPTRSFTSSPSHENLALRENPTDRPPSHLSIFPLFLPLPSLKDPCPYRAYWGRRGKEKGPESLGGRRINIGFVGSPWSPGPLRKLSREQPKQIVPVRSGSPPLVCLFTQTLRMAAMTDGDQREWARERERFIHTYTHLSILGFHTCINYAFVWVAQGATQNDNKDIWRFRCNLLLSFFFSTSHCPNRSICMSVIAPLPSALSALCVSLCRWDQWLKGADQRMLLWITKACVPNGTLFLIYCTTFDQITMGPGQM